MIFYNKNICMTSQKPDSIEVIKVNFNKDALPKYVNMSTMVLTSELDTTIDTFSVGKYIDLRRNGVLSTKYSNNSIVRSIIVLKMKNKKKVKKAKCNFLNSTTIVVQIRDNKRVNIKLFQNGAIQMTGCKNIDDFIAGLDVICRELKKVKVIYNIGDGTLTRKPFVDKPENVSIDGIKNFYIRLINCHFHVEFQIDRPVLYKILQDMNVCSTFEPCSHAGVNIKYIYKNKAIISIFVFESGSIIITGAKTKYQVYRSYQFIIAVLYQNYNKLVKINIDDFLEKPEIRQLVDEYFHNFVESINDRYVDPENDHPTEN